MHPNVGSNFIYNFQDMKSNINVYQQVNGQIMHCLHLEHGITKSYLKKVWNFAICNMDEPGGFINMFSEVSQTQKRICDIF